LKRVLGTTIVFALVLAAVDCTAASRRLVRRLERAIAEIPYVDSHCHVPAPATIRDGVLKNGKYDVPYLLGQATYVAEFTYGKNWDEIGEALKINAHHAYYRPMVEAMRDLYGLGRDEELGEDNIDEISARMDAAHRDPGWYDEVLDRANIRHVVWLGGDSRRGREAMPSPRFHPLWNIDGDFVFLSGQDKKSKKWNVDSMMERFDVKLRGLDDMDGLIEREIATFFKRGGVGLKSTSAYFRALDFDDSVSREAAEEAFKKILAHKECGKEESKLLQDYLMTRVFKAVAAHKKPMQFHTGNQQNWGYLPWSDPTALNDLLYSGAWWDVKFVLLHGGYPFSREAITITRYFGNVYLDLAWMTLFSPAAAGNVVAEALDILDGSNLMMGTDTASLEGMYATVKFTRRVLAEVLADKIESGYLSEEVALQAARRVLHDNAAALYGLKRD
jgi:predicted TIM-barrel fold metal-dependent hydrolase